MILDLLAQGETRHITLVYGARNRAELYSHEQFEALASTHPNFTYVPALNEPAPPRATGSDSGVSFTRLRQITSTTTSAAVVPISAARR